MARRSRRFRGPRQAQPQHLAAVATLPAAQDPVDVVIVDGFSLARLGQSSPDLTQLLDVLDAAAATHPDAPAVAIVDAAMPHRLRPADRGRYDAEMLAGRIVAAPAGCVGGVTRFLEEVMSRAGGRARLVTCSSQLRPVLGVAVCTAQRHGQVWAFAAAA